MRIIYIVTLKTHILEKSNYNIAGLIIAFCFFASCQNRTENKTEKNADVRPFEINQTLIDSFHRDSRLRPDNSDFDFYNVKTLIVDLNDNKQGDTIILKRLKGWENDPGDFQQIQIITDNGYSWKETNFNGWVRFDNNYYVPVSIKRINQLDTDLLLLTDFENTKILGLFGWVYASESGLLTIIDFSTKKPRIIINKNMDLVAIDKQKITIQDSGDKCWIENINNRLIMTCE